MSFEKTQKIFTQYGADIGESSEIYAYLATNVSKEQKLLEMVTKNNKNNQLPPLILFGPVHYLLLKGYDHPLKNYYPTITGTPVTDYNGFYELFQDFCQKNSQEIIQLMQTKIIQTNEVRRSTVLLTGFNWIINREKKSNLSLIEIGCSAGLNLYWDKYCYKYEEKSIGINPCNFILDIQVKGDFRPDLDLKSVQIIDRFGIDLNPLDLKNEEDGLWLQALIWPEQLKRLHNLQKAIKISGNELKTLFKGNAALELPKIINKTNKESILVIYQSFAFYLFSDKDKQTIQDYLIEYSKNRQIYLLSMEWQGVEGKRTFLKVDHFKQGNMESFILAECHHHAKWIKWLQ